MTLKQLKKEILKEFRLSLDSNSKFFNEDIRAFSGRLDGESRKDILTKQLGNLRSLNGKNKSFNKSVENIQKELEVSGMFNVKGMKPENALD